MMGSLLATFCTLSTLLTSRLKLGGESQLFVATCVNLRLYIYIYQQVCMYKLVTHYVTWKSLVHVIMYVNT
jgi:hypothetical protein